MGGPHWRVEVDCWLHPYRYQHRPVGLPLDEGRRVRTSPRHYYQRGEAEGPDRSYDRPESQPHRGSCFELRLREGAVEEGLNCASSGQLLEENKYFNVDFLNSGVVPPLGTRIKLNPPPPKKKKNPPQKKKKKKKKKS